MNFYPPEMIRNKWQFTETRLIYIQYCLVEVLGSVDMSIISQLGYEVPKLVLDADVSSSLVCYARRFLQGWGVKDHQGAN